MNRRTKFLRRCFNRIASLQQFKADLVDILDLLGPIAKARNAVVHSALAGYTQTTGQYLFFSIEASDKDIHEVNSFTITAAELRAATIDIQRLVRLCNALENHLMESFVRQNPIHDPLATI